MKLALAGVLGGLQSLAHDDAREKPIDRLGGMGFIGRTKPDERDGVQQARAVDAMRTAVLSALGVDLIAFKFGARMASRLDAEDMLAAILAWPSWKLQVTTRQRTRIAKWAIHEWASDLCPPRPDGCGGAKEVPDHNHQQLEGTQPMRPCPVCHATGKRHYTDAERIEAMGEAFAKAMFEAHGIIGRAETLATGGAKKMLERGLDT